MNLLRTITIGCSVVLGLSTASYAQRPTEVVKWTASATKSAGNAAAVTLSASIQDGWHVYALSQPPGGPTPLKISEPSGSSFEIAQPVKEVKVVRHDDPNFKIETLYYLKDMTFHIALKSTGAASASPIPIDVRFQACNDRLCLPPYTAHLTATLAR